VLVASGRRESLSTENFFMADAAHHRERLAEALGILLGRRMRALGDHSEGEQPRWLEEASQLLAAVCSDASSAARVATLAALVHGAIYGLTLMSYGEASEAYLNELAQPKPEKAAEQ
jgi:hypothetical protein